VLARMVNSQHKSKSTTNPVTRNGGCLNMRAGHWQGGFATGACSFALLSVGPGGGGGFWNRDVEVLTVVGPGQLVVLLAQGARAAAPGGAEVVAGHRLQRVGVRGLVCAVGWGRDSVVHELHACSHKAATKGGGDPARGDACRNRYASRAEVGSGAELTLRLYFFLIACLVPIWRMHGTPTM
jgi:hypothetical protein